MTIETKYGIGDRVALVTDLTNEWIVTSIQIRPHDCISYQLTHGQTAYWAFDIEVTDVKEKKIGYINGNTQ